MTMKMTTYYQGKDIPDLPGTNTFHSKELFLIYEATPGYTPMLIVASLHNRPVAKLLATIRKSRSWMPFSMARQCVIYDTGEILLPEAIGNKELEEEIFGNLLEHLTQEVLHSCLIIEFRNLSNAMFGYRYFRQNGFFPVNWLRVRNSLHDLSRIEERFSPSRIRQVKKGFKNGALVTETQDVKEIQQFARMLHHVYSSRIRRYFPNKEFFQQMSHWIVQQQRGKIYTVKYKGKIIGGSVCIYSNDNAYLWFSGGMTKTYALQYPGILAVWKALEDAHRQGYCHLEFMDVGLPFHKHGYRNFVLRFGGKQSSTRRWFRIRWNWLNRLLTQFYL